MRSHPHLEPQESETVRLRYRSRLSVAERVVPLYLAEIMEEVAMRTMNVLTGKVALVAPAGMITLDGTLAAPLLLASATCAPPPGTRPLRVTVPVEDSRPPTTLVGFKLSERRTGTTGVTVSEADLVAPL